MKDRQMEITDKQVEAFLEEQEVSVHVVQRLPMNDVNVYIPNFLNQEKILNLVKKDLKEHPQAPDVKSAVVYITSEDYKDGDDFFVVYERNNVPMERIRRITGYLTGDLNRFNDAKRAEERDRVKHGLYV